MRAAAYFHAVMVKNPPSRSRCARWLLAGSAVLGSILVQAQGAPALAQSLVLKPCRIPGVSSELRCGVLARPLRADQPDGTTIDVHVAVVPAVARRKLDDAVFFLAGGPGQSAIDLVPNMLPLLARLNQRRDLVFVDQRGTGQSAPLLCETDPSLSAVQAWARGADPSAAAEDAQTCVRQLQTLPWVKQRQDLAQFTTEQASQDLEAVRQALALPAINLVGASYGTRAALDYKRQFPQAVRRMVIDGVAPPDMGLHRSSGPDAQAALDAVWTSCEAQADCKSAFGDVRADWAQLLAHAPQTVSLRDPYTGTEQTVRTTPAMLQAAARAPLYAPALAAGLPYAVHQAARGQYEPLAGLFSALSPRHGPKLYLGMHFAVVCAEDVQREVHASTKEPTDAAAERYRAMCRQWPTAPVGAAFDRLTASTAPVLLLSGGLDPITPPRHAERVQQALGANAVHVVVPNAGHGVLGLGCMRDVVHRFFDSASHAEALTIDATCAQNIPRPPAFVPSVPGRAP